MNITNKIIFDKLKTIEEKQDITHEIVIRHDEKIKGLWKIPVLSGGIVGLIMAIGIVISFLH